MSSFDWSRLISLKAAALLSAGGFIIGVLFWGGFNTAMEATNTLSFCISCHEMKDTVYQEYKTSVHYQNRSGVRAICSDCHVPHPWIYKMKRKIQASNEVWHKLIGTVDTPEKFEAHRLELAQHVWATMKSTDSRECRNCHNFEAMAQDKQKPRAWGQHSEAMKANPATSDWFSQITGDRPEAKEGTTCIDCHKGIAHKAVHQKVEAAPTNFDLP